MLTLLTIALASTALFLPDVSARELTQYGDPGNTNGCSNYVQILYTGSCASFSNYLADRADQAWNADKGTFAGLAAGAPQPDGECCNNARGFTNYGCACNQGAIQDYASQGMTKNVMVTISRGTQVRCGGCSDPCGYNA